MKLTNHLTRASALVILLSMSSSQAAHDSLIHVKTDDQYKNILAEKKPVLIDFYADWCGVCKRAEPDIKNLAKRFTNITFIKLDGDTFKDLKRKYKVVGYPTFILLDTTGKEIDRIVGRKMEAVEKALQKIKITKPIDVKKPAKKEPVAKPEVPKPTVPKKEDLKPTPPAKEECTVRCELPAKKPAEIKPRVTETNLIDLSNAEEFDVILAQAKPMVLDFYTSWCGPCKTMKPIIAELAKEYTEVNFVTIDAEKIPSIAKRYPIDGYPTFIFLNATGKQAAAHSGSASKTMMKGKLGKITTAKDIMFLEEHEIPMKTKPVVAKPAPKKQSRRRRRSK